MAGKISEGGSSRPIPTNSCFLWDCFSAFISLISGAVSCIFSCFGCLGETSQRGDENSLVGRTSREPEPNSDEERTQKVFSENIGSSSSSEDDSEEDPIPLKSFPSPLPSNPIERQDSKSVSFTPTRDYILPLKEKGQNKEQCNFLITKAQEFCQDQSQNARIRDQLFPLFSEIFEQNAFGENSKIYIEEQYEIYSRLATNAGINESFETRKIPTGFGYNRSEIYQAAAQFFASFLPSLKHPLTKDQHAFLLAAAQDFVNGLDEGEKDRVSKQILRLLDIARPLEKALNNKLSEWINDFKKMPAPSEELLVSLKFLHQFFYKTPLALTLEREKPQNLASDISAAKPIQDPFLSLSEKSPNTELTNFWITEAKAFCAALPSNQQAIFTASFIEYFTNPSFAKNPQFHMYPRSSRQKSLGYSQMNELVKKFYEERLPRKALSPSLSIGAVKSKFPDTILLEGQKKYLIAAAKDFAASLDGEKKKTFEDDFNERLNNPNFQENPYIKLTGWLEEKRKLGARPFDSFKFLYEHFSILALNPEIFPS